MKTIKVELEITRSMLGTVPKNKNIYADHIASKAPVGADTEAEVESVEEMEEKGWTGFHGPADAPFLYDYVIKGFFKDACSMLRRVTVTRSAKLTAYKKAIDGLVFVFPREIPINVNGHGLEVIERPLRVQTAKGERVALARSDAAPAGSKISFEVKLLGGGVTVELLKEWLDYGELRGLGQWRNSGYGAFTYKIDAVASLCQE